MKLYLLSQNINRGYDTFDSCVVAAKSQEDARTIHPDNHPLSDEGIWSWVTREQMDKIEIKYLGETEEPRGVICASFNAG